jgi:NADH-quinone oxidoreductase subunit J
MSLLILVAVLILALASITLDKTVPAMISFAMMMFLLGLYYLLLDEKLLGLLQIFVYTGGIVVLMLFGITVIGEEFPPAKARGWAIVAAVLVAAALTYLLLVVLSVPKVDTTAVTQQASYFSQHYADLVLIFALIGASLLYGSMKMLRFLRCKASDHV